MIQQLSVLSNELGLILLAGVVLSAGLVNGRKADGRRELGISSVGLLVLLVLSIGGWIPSGVAFGGAYASGSLAGIFKQIFLLAGVCMVWLSWPVERREDAQLLDHLGEYLALMLFSLAGMCLLVSSRELVLLYVSLELVTMPLVLLVAFNRHESRGAEAALKYAFFSALASGLLLYGLSLLYGLTGTTMIAESADRLTMGPLATWALVLVMAGVGFKISAVPFHLWTPDTYEGAPIPVAAFLSVASKAAGFVLFYQLVYGVFGRIPQAVEQIVTVLAALTMTVGNLIAMHQTNLKRFLAYSSIAQAGYVMMGLSNPGILGWSSVVYYLIVYLVSNLAAFGVVSIVAAATGKEHMQEYAGLSQSNPRLALVMMLAMFSLAGIPPLAGFLGKFYLFASAAEKGLYWLVLVGAVNATMSLYYYLLVIKWMYIVRPEGSNGITARVPVSWPSGLVLGINTLAMLVIGITPQIIRWVEQAASSVVNQAGLM
jgi:NADH-quinone oxidoreductase subunit N